MAYAPAPRIGKFAGPQVERPVRKPKPRKASKKKLAIQPVAPGLINQ
jgi:hypothetical protein